MVSISTGDLAQAVFMRRQNAQLKAEMHRLAQELSSGRVSDSAKHLGADFSFLGDVEHGLRMNSAYRQATTEAGVFAGAMQTNLSKLNAELSSLSAALLSSGAGGGSATSQTQLANQAEAALDAMITTLNADSAGRALFAGSQSNGAALAGSDVMLNELRLAVAGAASLSDVQTAIDDWFDAPGGGFEVLGYLGGADDIAAFQLGDGESVAFRVKADDPAFRAALKAASLAVLAKDETLGLSSQVEAGMFDLARDWALVGQDAVTGIQARIGHTQERISVTEARLEAAQTSLQMAQSDLLRADPYETAVRLEETQFQLESLYTVTVRLSQLSLARFLQ